VHIKLGADFAGRSVDARLEGVAVGLVGVALVEEALPALAHLGAVAGAGCRALGIHVGLHSASIWGSMLQFLKYMRRNNRRKISAFFSLKTQLFYLEKAIT
jgi:hypothetical protein